jgi:hypothetical protein
MLTPLIVAGGGDQGAMVAPLWRGVNRLVVHCLSMEAASSERLCSAALADIRRDSPWPVIAQTAVAELRRSDAVVRLRVADGVLLVSVERAVVIDESEGGIAARPVPINLDDVDSVTIALARSMNTALPWRHRRASAARSRRPPTD